MRIADKKALVEDLRERFAKSKLVVLTDYKGLDVMTVNDLRRKLKDADIEYRVVKNTLLRLAAADTEVAVIMDHFKGPSAIALSYDDPVAPAQVLTKFAEENKKLEIKVGVLNGKVVDAGGIKALSKLPSRETLLAQVLAAMNGVPTSLVRVLSAVPVSLLNVLQAIQQEKEKAAASH